MSPIRRALSDWRASSRTRGSSPPPTARSPSLYSLARTNVVRRSTAPSVSRTSASERQAECSHLFAVANEQRVANQRRVIPGLAFEGRESRELFEPIGSRTDERQLTFLRHDQQHVLVRQQHQLAVAVASTLPLPRPVLEIDAGENGAVEAVGVALV